MRAVKLCCVVDAAHALGLSAHHTAAMTVAGSVVVALLATSANAFVAPSIARTGALRQAGVKESHIPSKARVPGFEQLPRSSFVSGVSTAARAERGSSGSRGGALSMKVINVGVIGAGRCVTVYCC